MLNIADIAETQSQFFAQIVPVRVRGQWISWGINANETFSGAAHRWYLEGRFVRVRSVINVIFFLQDDHCRYSFEKDYFRAKKTTDFFESRDYDQWL